MQLPLNCNGMHLFLSSFATFHSRPLWPENLLFSIYLPLELYWSSPTRFSLRSVLALSAFLFHIRPFLTWRTINMLSLPFSSRGREIKTIRRCPCPIIHSGAKNSGWFIPVANICAKSFSIETPSRALQVYLLGSLPPLGRPPPRHPNFLFTGTVVCLLRIASFKDFRFLFLFPFSPIRLAVVSDRWFSRLPVCLIKIRPP